MKFLFSLSLVFGVALLAPALAAAQCGVGGCYQQVQYVQSVQVQYVQPVRVLQVQQVYAVQQYVAPVQVQYQQVQRVQVQQVKYVQQVQQVKVQRVQVQAVNFYPAAVVQVNVRRGLFGRTIIR